LSEIKHNTHTHSQRRGIHARSGDGRPWDLLVGGGRGGCQWNVGVPTEKIGLPQRITAELVGVGISAKRGGELGHGVEGCAGR